MNSQQELLEAINTITDNKDKSFDTPATVLRVEGDTVWVHIDGGADETPVQKTINCDEGETVQVRISNGSAFLVGNASAPPTDDTTANEAHFVAEQADEKATEAVKSVNAIVQTVEGKVDSGDSNILDISSTMYQDAYGVNIFNDTLAVGDSYAHIDGDSFDIKQATTAGTIDNTNDTLVASFGSEVTIGSRASGSSVGNHSQVYGFVCEASGNYAHASGYESWANENYAHASGYIAKALGSASHAEGSHTTASGTYSHAEGRITTASGTGSHAEGSYTTADGDYSHAQNYYTVAASDYQTVMGRYNIPDSNDMYAFIIGNGMFEGALSDAFRVDWSGNVRIAGEIKDMSGNNLLDEWTSAEQVANGQVTFTGLDDTKGWAYIPTFWVDDNSTNKNPKATINTVSGAGTSSMSVTYDTDADSGSDCRLRIEK